MKNIFLSMIVGLVMMQSACLTSLHPLVTPDNISADDRIVGTWMSDDDTIQIRKFNDSKSYNELFKIELVPRMSGEKLKLDKKDSIMYANGYSVFYRKDGVEYYMFGGITRIGKNQFINLLPIVAHDPANDRTTGFEYTNDYLTTFTVAKLQVSGNNALTIKFLDGDFIKEQLRKGNIRIKHEKDELFDQFLVTASTPELRQFLDKYGHDERLFSQENSITLTKKG